MVKKFCDLKYDEPTLLWDEGIPLGCGKQGTLIYGDGSPLIFSVDRGDLWDTRQTNFAESEGYNFPNLVHLVKDKLFDKIRTDFSSPATFPTKLPPHRIKANFAQKISKFNMYLSLQKAEATVELSFENKKQTLVKVIEHATEFCGVMQISGVLPEFCLEMPNYNPDESKMDFTVFKSLKPLGYPECNYVVKKDGDYTIYIGIQPTANEFTYALVFITKQSSEKIEGVYTTAISKDGDDWIDCTINALKKILDKGYDELINTHLRWWDNFWKESSISISCDKKMEKLWYLNNYFLGAGSRKEFLPMALQGVWTADVHAVPPWRGDYHNNQNVQQTYNSYVVANHMDAGSAMTKLMLNSKEAARKHAKRFYRTSKGLSLPPTMTHEGEVVTGWPQVNGIPTNHLWLCKILERHAKYQGDDVFLREEVYPYFVESSECILELLEEKDGLLYLPVSTSPEHYETTPKSWLKPNSNYDLACLRYFFNALKEMAKMLGYEADEKKWTEIFNKLPYYDLLENGELMLAKDEPMVESYLHHGHAMAIYPFNELDVKNPNDRKIIESTIYRLEVLGIGKWVGYSFPWMASIYTRANRGEAARHQLLVFDECFCSINGFNLNGDFKLKGTGCLKYRPFTLEANLAAADAIQEMLIQSHKGVVEVFPAIPDKWAKYGVEFKTFRAMGGFLISAKIKDRKIQYIKVKSTGDRILKLVVNMRNPIFSNKNINDYNIKNGVLTIKMNKNDSFKVIEKIST